ncbi:MAG: 4a-hydroxytetrahydrobiopterin dehydratase [Phycisphaerales bacterium]|nr:4a-hydroxytetrahydrobiopterin dehydratase [Phycisphaerales bacterium]
MSESESQRLDEPQISLALDTLTEWVRSGDVIQRTFVLADFATAMAFVNQVAAVAEAAGHHPDILIRWSKVTLSLSTHDAGGLTKLDFNLAAAIDSLV